MDERTPAGMQQIKWRLHVPAETASPLEPRCGDAEVIPCPQEDPLFLPKKMDESHDESPILSSSHFPGGPGSQHQWFGLSLRETLQKTGRMEVPRFRQKKSPSNEKQIVGQSK